MFTKQIAQIAQQLVDAGMPESQANIIMNGFGNCIADLLHRGTITVINDTPQTPIYDPDNPPEGPVVDPENPTNVTPSGIVNIIGGGTWNTTDETVQGPFSLNVIGPSNLDGPVLVHGPLIFVIPPGASVGDSGKVRTADTDDLDFLEDQLYNIANLGTKPSTALDIPAYSDQDQVRFSLAPSNITSGYAGSSKQVLGHDTSGAWKWYTISAC